MSKNSRMMSGLMVGLVLTFGSVFVAFGVPAHGASRPSTLTVSTAKQISSFASYRGHTLVAFFIATSCKFCAFEAQHEIPAVIRWAQEHGVTIVIVNASDTLGLGKSGPTPSQGVDGPWTPNTNAEKLASDMYRWGTAFHLVKYVYVNASLSLFKSYKIGGFPAGLVLDSKGRFVAKWKGLLPVREIEDVAKLADISDFSK